MSTDGSELTTITSAPGDDYPSELIWSPDGTQIAFSYGKERNLPIYLLNIKNKTLKNLSNASEKQAYSGLLSWSPDGTRLAYYHDQGSQEFGIQLDIFVLDIFQGTVKKLTDKPGNIVNCSGHQIASRLLLQAEIFLIKSCTRSQLMNSSSPS